MIGQTISHYRVLDKLGQGGMGIVYKAEDTRLKRTVALKILPPELTRDPEAKQRFVHEAQAASALEHHNICNMHEIDETDDGQVFIVMAYFGLAKLAGRTKVTKTGTTLGTVAYMSPEQARREEVDHRTDIWSLGVW